MIELFDDFRDLLVELHSAGARFVVLGGHAVAFHGHPRATKDLDVLVEADVDNAKRVYAALAAFGAPLSAFEVGVEDFASYDGLPATGRPGNHDHPRTGHAMLSSLERGIRLGQHVRRELGRHKLPLGVDDP